MPLLSTSSTLLASTGFTTAYLSSIYLLPSTRVSHSKKTDAPPPPPEEDIASSVPTAPSPVRDRNHPSVIKARLLAVSLASTASCAAFSLLLSSSSTTTPSPTSYTHALPLAAQLLGLFPLSPTSSALEAVRLVLYPLGLTASLFAGTWYVQYLAGELPWQRGWTGGGGWWKNVKSKFDGWRGVRNYVVAPLTEEITFRSCILAVSHLGGFSKSSLVFLTPMWFGLAHVHHAWETYLAGGKTKQALIQGILQSTFQFAYTTLFGWYASFLFLRTGSLLPPFLAHSLCNMLGLPPLGWALHYFPEKKISIYSTYLSGIALFSYGLFRWTEPALFGGSLYWA